MNALSIATKRFHTALVDDSIALVQELLSSQNISFVPVVDSCGKCFGVISAKDLLHFHHEKRNAIAEHAWEICTHKIIEVHPLASLEQLVELVLENAVHHLIVTEKGVIKGVISSVDVIRAMHQSHMLAAQVG